MNTPSHSSPSGDDWGSPMGGGSGPAGPPQQPYQAPQQPYQAPFPQYQPYQQPTYGGGPGYPGGPVPNFLVWAILSTLLCLPTGIVAIVFASQASSKQSAGDYRGAHDAAGKAKIWCIVGTALGGLWLIIILANAASA